jgi:hypothetical protein
MLVLQKLTLLTSLTLAHKSWGQSLNNLGLVLYKNGLNLRLVLTQYPFLTNCYEELNFS